MTQNAFKEQVKGVVILRSQDLELFVVSVLCSFKMRLLSVVSPKTEKQVSPGQPSTNLETIIIHVPCASVFEPLSLSRKMTLTTYLSIFSRVS